MNMAILTLPRPTDAVVLKQSLGGTGTNTPAFNGASRKYVSSRFTSLSGGYSLRRVDVMFKKNASPVGTIAAYLYSNTSNLPVTLLATSTNTLDASTIATSYTLYQFDFAGYTFASSTIYHIVLDRSGSSSGVNYVLWDAAASGGNFNVSADASSWTFSSDANQRMDLYGL